MERLERYLDWVCGRLGGPREMRSHLRQELREHLLDAAGEHQAAGMNIEEALKRALDDFGAPDDVRGELEETHGARVAAIVLETAMQWKEQTMKATWLWKAWAHVATITVIALGAVFVAGMIIYLMPKVREISLMADTDGRGIDGVLPGSATFLEIVRMLVVYAWVPTLLLGGLWIWFEKRVKSENKSWMRLSALAAAAALTMVLAITIAIIAAIPLAIAAPRLTARLPENVVVDELADLRRWEAKVDQAAAEKNWQGLDDAAHEGSGVAARLALDGGSAPGLVALDQPARVQTIREQLASVRRSLLEVRDAARKKDEPRALTAVRDFHAALALVDVVAPIQ